MERHRVVVALSGEEVVGVMAWPNPTREIELWQPAWTRGRGVRRGAARGLAEEGVTWG
jgi:hypothetical protein